MTPKFNQNFWKWFGDSKVVDEKGNPLIVYHGTYWSFGDKQTGSFNKFYTDRELGAHFAESSYLASGCSNYGAPEDEAKQCRVYPVYLSIQNPVHLPDMGEWDIPDSWENEAENDTSNPVIKKIVQLMLKKGRYIDIKKALIDMGFDGAAYVNDYEYPGNEDYNPQCYIAFYPWQIKSVHNSGAWSRKTGNIMNPPKLRPGWKRGPCGPYGDMGYVRGRYGVARKYTASCTPSKTTWKVFYDGRGIDSWDLPLVEVLRIVEGQIQMDEKEKL